MKTLQALACFLCFACSLAVAQKSGGGKTTMSSNPQQGVPDTFSRGSISLSGKVVVDDGSALNGSALILTVCNGQKHTETHTDSQGHFSFQWGSSFADSESDDFASDPKVRTTPGGAVAPRDPRTCELQASLPGFVSKSIELAGQFSGLDSVDIGRLVVHRMGNVEGYTMSVTTAQAPGPARKAFEKGQQQKKNGKLDEAQAFFEKAVSIYPKFAEAWFELGGVQLQKNDPGGARHSFRQGIEADAKYVKPYLGLTQIAQREGNYKELLEVTDQLLALDPVSFPHVWLGNGLANYFLQSYATAEKSVRRGLQLDPEHHLPGLEYLLGMVLLKKPDYAEAAEHLRAYLKRATTPAETAEAQKQLDEVARLLAAANLPGGKDK
jgi:TolA-binding protein